MVQTKPGPRWIGCSSVAVGCWLGVVSISEVLCSLNDDVENRA